MVSPKGVAIVQIATRSPRCRWQLVITAIMNHVSYFCTIPKYNYGNSFAGSIAANFLPAAASRTWKNSMGSAPFLPTVPIA